MFVQLSSFFLRLHDKIENYGKRKCGDNAITMISALSLLLTRESKYVFMEEACLTEMEDVNGERERRDCVTNVSCVEWPIMESVAEVSIAGEKERIRE